jgi:hypothetical protein
MAPNDLSLICTRGIYRYILINGRPVQLTSHRATAKKASSKPAKTVKVNVDNNTGGLLTILLSGASSYTFTVTGAKAQLYVAKGKYDYTVRGVCGVKSGTVNIRGGLRWAGIAIKKLEGKAGTPASQGAGVQIIDRQIRIDQQIHALVMQVGEHQMITKLVII